MPQFAEHAALALVRVLRRFQAVVEGDEIKRLADPCDCGDDVKPANREIQPVGDKAFHETPPLLIRCSRRRCVRHAAPRTAGRKTRCAHLRADGVVFHSSLSFVIALLQSTARFCGCRSISCRDKCCTTTARRAAARDSARWHRRCRSATRRDPRNAARAPWCRSTRSNRPHANTSSYSPGNERVALQQRCVAAAVVIGEGGFQRAARVARQREEFDLDARAGTSVRGVEHMGSELSHSQFSLCVCEDRRQHRSSSTLAADRGSTSVATYPSAD